jgi:uncharacterized protein (TIGR03000 family)
MYTVVMMAALTASPATTGFGCHGWNVATNSYCQGCAGGCTGAHYGAGTYYGIGNSGNSSIYAPPHCVGVFSCSGCYGCYGGWSCYGVALPQHGYWNECVPGATEPRKTSPNLEETPAPKEIKGKQQTRAQVIIDAPADAKIYVDGQLIHAGKRTFYTPELTPGEKYFYDVRAEIVRDGQTAFETQRIILDAGHSVTAAFPNLGQEAAITARTGQ